MSYVGVDFYLAEIQSALSRLCSADGGDAASAPPEVCSVADVVDDADIPLSKYVPTVVSLAAEILSMQLGVDQDALSNLLHGHRWQVLLNDGKVAHSGLRLSALLQAAGSGDSLSLTLKPCAVTSRKRHEGSTEDSSETRQHTTNSHGLLLNGPAPSVSHKRQKCNDDSHSRQPLPLLEDNMHDHDSMSPSSCSTASAALVDDNGNGNAALQLSLSAQHIDTTSVSAMKQEYDGLGASSSAFLNGPARASHPTISMRSSSFHASSVISTASSPLFEETTAAVGSWPQSSLPQLSSAVATGAVPSVGAAPQPMPVPTGTSEADLSDRPLARFRLSVLNCLVPSPHLYDLPRVSAQLSSVGGAEVELSCSKSHFLDRLVMMKHGASSLLSDYKLELLWPFFAGEEASVFDKNESLTQKVLSSEKVFRLAAVYSAAHEGGGWLDVTLYLRRDRIYGQHELDRTDQATDMRTEEAIDKINSVLVALSLLTPLALTPLSPKPTVEEQHALFNRMIETDIPQMKPKHDVQCQKLSEHYLQPGILLDPTQLFTVRFLIARLVSVTPVLLTLPHFTPLSLANQGRQLLYNPVTGEFSESGVPYIRIPTNILALFNHMGTGKTLCAFLFMLLVMDEDKRQRTAASTSSGEVVRSIPSSATGAAPSSSGASARRPFLVVVSSALLDQWRKQLKDLIKSDSLRCRLLKRADDGPHSTANIHSVEELYRAMENGSCHFILTTFTTLRHFEKGKKGMNKLDCTRLHFRGLIVDEAQSLDNFIAKDKLTKLFYKMTFDFVLTITGTPVHEKGLSNVQRLLQVPPVQPLSDNRYWGRAIARPFLSGNTAAQQTLQTFFKTNCLRLKPMQLMNRLFLSHGVTIKHHRQLIPQNQLEQATTAYVRFMNDRHKYEPKVARDNERLVADDVTLLPDLPSVRGEKPAETQQRVLRHMQTVLHAQVIRACRQFVHSGHILAQFRLHSVSSALVGVLFDPSLPVDVSCCDDFDVLLNVANLYRSLMGPAGELRGADHQQARLSIMMGDCLQRCAALRPDEDESAQLAREGQQYTFDGRRRMQQWMDELVAVGRRAAANELDIIKAGHGDVLGDYCTQLPAILDGISDDKLNQLKRDLHHDLTYLTIRHGISIDEVWEMAMFTLGRGVVARNTALLIAERLVGSDMNAIVYGCTCHNSRLEPHTVPHNDVHSLLQPRAPQFDPRLDDFNAHQVDIRDMSVCLLCQLRHAVKALITLLPQHRYCLATKALRMIVRESSFSSETLQLEPCIDSLKSDERGLLTGILEEMYTVLLNMQDLVLDFEVDTNQLKSRRGNADLKSLEDNHNKAQEALETARQLQSRLATTSCNEAPTKLYAFKLLVRSILGDVATPSSSSSSSSTSSSSPSSPSSPSSASSENSPSSTPDSSVRVTAPPHVLVFSEFAGELALLESYLKVSRYRKHYARLPDATSVDYNSIITKFNNPLHRYRILLLSPSQGSEGLNLPVGTHVLFMEGASSPSVMWQSIFRIIRLGRRHVKLNSYTLSARGTVDERMHYPRNEDTDSHMNVDNEGTPAVNVASSVRRPLTAPFNNAAAAAQLQL